MKKAFGLCFIIIGILIIIGFPCIGIIPGLIAILLGGFLLF